MAGTAPKIFARKGVRIVWPGLRRSSPAILAVASSRAREPCRLPRLSHRPPSTLGCVRPPRLHVGSLTRSGRVRKAPSMQSRQKAGPNGSTASARSMQDSERSRPQIDGNATATAIYDHVRQTEVFQDVLASLLVLLRPTAAHQKHLEKFQNLSAELQDLSTRREVTFG